MAAAPPPAMGTRSATDPTVQLEIKVAAMMAEITELKTYNGSLQSNYNLERKRANTLAAVNRQLKSGLEARIGKIGLIDDHSAGNKSQHVARIRLFLWQFCSEDIAELVVAALRGR